MKLKAGLILLWALAVGAPARAGAAVVSDLPAGLSETRTGMRASSRPATPDLVATLWLCPHCKRPSPSIRTIPEQPPFDRLDDVKLLLIRVGLGQGGAWNPPDPGVCRLCGGKAPNKLEITEVVFFRYLHETGCDAVARLAVSKGRAGKLTWGKLDVSGAFDPVGEIADGSAFAAAFGRVLSVREAWVGVTRRTISKGKPTVAKAADGYFLTCRLRSAVAAEDERLTAELRIELAKLWGGRIPASAQAFPLVAVIGTDLEKVVPTYRRWLPGQWKQLESGKYVAQAFVDPEVFWKLARREMADRELNLEIENQRAALRVGAYSLSLGPETFLAKTVHSGLSFGAGLHQFIWPAGLKLLKVAEVGAQARRALGAYETDVAEGSRLVIRERPAEGQPAGSGREVSRINLFALAGGVDPRARGAVAGALSGLLGLDQASGRLRPPGAGDVRCACRARAWLAKKLRPAEYFRLLDVEVATTEWRGLTVAWSLDCIRHGRFLPAGGAPATEKLEERYQKDLAGAEFSVIAAKGLAFEGLQARLAVGTDIASALIDPRTRRGLAIRLKAEVPGMELFFWAPTTNVVLVSPQPLAGEARQEFRRAALEEVRRAGLAPGFEVDVELREKPTEKKPAGVFGKNY